MSTGPRVVALLWLEGVANVDVEEVLRLLTAFVACGASLRLLVAERDLGRLGEDVASTETTSMLEALGGFGVEPESLEAADLANALAEADHVVRLGPPDRTGIPLALDPHARGVTIQALREAGQVLG